MKPTDRLQTSDDAVSRMVGGEVVLLNLTSGLYFGLDEVGAAIWTLIEEQEPVAIEAIAAAICEQYAVEPEVAGRDVLELAQSLVEQGLVEIHAD